MVLTRDQFNKLFFNKPFRKKTSSVKKPRKLGNPSNAGSKAKLSPSTSQNLNSSPFQMKANVL